MAPAPTHDFSGLTDDEFAEMEAFSLQRTGEDATEWAARNQQAARQYAEIAAKRRAEQTGPTLDESFDPGTGEGQSTGPVNS